MKIFAKNLSNYLIDNNINSKMLKEIIANYNIFLYPYGYVFRKDHETAISKMLTSDNYLGKNTDCKIIFCLPCRDNTNADRYFVFYTNLSEEFILKLLKLRAFN